MRGWMLALLLLGGANTAQAAGVIKCNGYVSFKDGTMEGNAEITLEKKPDGKWTLNGFDAGANRSKSPKVLDLDTYGLLRCRGASANYDYAKKTLKFRYKYDSGFLGGGCQKTGSTFTNCSEK